MSNMEIIPTLFEYQLSDNTNSSKTVSKQQAETIMQFFAAQPLFTWSHSNNGCEARADAVCVLLEQWRIPHYKAWVFSGNYLKNHLGGLKHNWKYHVAVLLQVMEEGQLMQYIIDPATSSQLQTLFNWSAGITDFAHSYHVIKEPAWYIFSDKKITAHNWHNRNRQNRKWMVQGLAGINGLNPKGKAALVFNKNKIKKTAIAFKKLMQQRPPA